jgi:hypothetical protein
LAGGTEVEALSSLSCGIVSMSGRRNPSSGIAGFIGFDGSDEGSGTIVATGTASVGLLASAGFAESGSVALGLNNEQAGKPARHSAAMQAVKNFLNVQSARINCPKQSRSSGRGEELLVICDWLLGIQKKPLLLLRLVSSSLLSPPLEP